jgi:hypothetical protein
MSRNDEQRPKKDAAADATPRKVGQSVQLPRPTRDQQNYLEEIKRSTGRYDPNVVVGGPRRPTA